MSDFERWWSESGWDGTVGRRLAQEAWDAALLHASNVFVQFAQEAFDKSMKEINDKT